jgi:hypothetical protein
VTEPLLIGRPPARSISFSPACADHSSPPTWPPTQRRLRTALRARRALLAVIGVRERRGHPGSERARQPRTARQPDLARRPRGRASRHTRAVAEAHAAGEWRIVRAREPRAAMERAADALVALRDAAAGALVGRAGRGS